MRPWSKGIAYILSTALLLSLCLSPAALGAEDVPPVPSSGPAEVGPEQAGPPEGEEPEWREAGTLEELEALLFGGMMSEGGHIRVTRDLLVPAGERTVIWPLVPQGTPLVVDLGGHTLAVEGELVVHPGIEFTGAGGEAGLVRVRPGGSAKLQSVLFTVTEPGGYAVWQEEGGALIYTAHEDTAGEVRFAPRPEAEAATFAELAALLEDGGLLETGGIIRAAGDLTVPAGTEYTIWPREPEHTLLTVDLGEHTLAVEGCLTVKPGVEFTGAGGGTGLVRVRSGGWASLSSVRLTATAAGGCALWQEEGGILEYEPADGSTGEVRFAQRPVAVPASSVSSVLFTPVALVRDGQTPEGLLPAEDGVQLYMDGAADMDAHIPVAWDLEPHRAQLNSRERVLVAGSYPEAEAYQPPVCLVVFQNGNPATFLNCFGTEGRGVPLATVQLALARPDLGCRFEWSQDGVTWLPAEAERSPAKDEFPVFYVSFPQDEPPDYPYYLSAVVEDPETGPGYSDVIVIERADVQCGNGGNRGGGTDITDPPGPPEPEPESPSEPPEQWEDNAGPGGPEVTTPPEAQETKVDGEQTPVPEPEQTPEPPGGGTAEPSSPPTPVPTRDPELALPSREPELPAAGMAEPDPPDAPSAPPPGTEPQPSPGPAAAQPPEPSPSREPPPEPADSGAGSEVPAADPDGEAAPVSVPTAPNPLSIAAGCVAIAATLGVAGCYLYPKAGRRLWGALKGLFKR